MWTDLSFNLLLLLMSDYVFVLAASNVSYGQGGDWSRASPLSGSDPRH